MGNPNSAGRGANQYQNKPGVNRTVTAPSARLLAQLNLSAEYAQSADYHFGPGCKAPRSAKAAAAAANRYAAAHPEMAMPPSRLQYLMRLSANEVYHEVTSRQNLVEGRSSHRLSREIPRGKVTAEDLTVLWSRYSPEAQGDGKRAIVRHPGCPPDVLERAIQDPARTVQKLAADHPNCPRHALAMWQLARN